MFPRIIWTLAAALVYGLIVYGHYWAVGASIIQDSQQMGVFIGGYALGFWILGIALLGAIARWCPRVNSVLWRPLMLLMGALLAIIEPLALAFTSPPALPTDLWGAALIGLTAAAVLPRLVPDSILCQWLAVDRRMSERLPSL